MCRYAIMVKFLVKCRLTEQQPNVHYSLHGACDYHYVALMGKV